MKSKLRHARNECVKRMWASQRYLMAYTANFSHVCGMYSLFVWKFR